MDTGQFNRVDVWEGRNLMVSAVVHPDGSGSQVRVAAGPDIVWLLAAHRLAAVIRAMPLQHSQRLLVSDLLSDLETSLEDYDDMIKASETDPF